MIYFSGKADQALRNNKQFGVMLSYRITGGEKKALESGAKWMIDNGCLSNNWRPERWLRRLDSLLPYADTCHGVIMPDVVRWANGDPLGDWRGTYNNLLEWFPLIVRDYPYPVAYALQDNHPPNIIPWNFFDTLFVAGSTQYKLSAQVEYIAKEAKARGKWVHVGRVNSAKRMGIVWWADSCDGTRFKHGNREFAYQSFVETMPNLKTKPRQWRLL